MSSKERLAQIDEAITLAREAQSTGHITVMIAALHLAGQLIQLEKLLGSGATEQPASLDEASDSA